MTRRLFNLAVVLSVLLCLGVAVLWIRSHLFQESLERRTAYSDAQLTEQRWLRFDSQKGKLYLGHGYHQVVKLLAAEVTSPPHWRYRRYPLSPVSASVGDGPAWLDRLGISRFVLSSKQLDPTGAGMVDYTWGLRFDYWLLLVMALMVSGMVVLARHRETLAARRLRARLCPNCGYDLRESPDRCPECGEIRNTISN
jgi:hypothetical protein